MRTPTRFKLPAVVAIAIGLSGCLTIEENYTFKKNGSGTMEYVIDLSELGEMMKSFSDMGGDDGAKTDEGLGTMDMNEEVAALKSIPGISKVKLDTKKEWVQRVKFSFKDVTALNAALNVLMPDSSGQPHTFFAWEGGTLVRTNNHHAYEIGAGMARGDAMDEDDGEDGGEDLDMSAMLASMKYKYSFKFQQPLEKTSAAEGMLVEPEGTKEVALSTDFAVISRDPKALDLRLELVK